MFKRLVLAFTVASTALFATAATGLAEELTHYETGLTFWLPDGWKQEQDGDFLTVESEKDGVMLFFLVSNESSVDEFMSGLAEELDKIMENAELSTQPKAEEVNGLTQAYVEGTGTIEGEKIDWDMTFIPGKKKSLAVVALGKLQENQATITKIYQSIKKSS